MTAVKNQFHDWWIQNRLRVSFAAKLGIVAACILGFIYAISVFNLNALTGG